MKWNRQSAWQRKFNMLKAIIYNLKDINADHLIENKCQAYAEGVDSALSEYNSIIIKSNDAETILKMKLAIAYASQVNAPNNAERVFQTGIIDFYEYILEELLDEIISLYLD